MKRALYIISTLLIVSVLSIAEPLITCEPRALRGVPGEPLLTTVTVETDRAAPIRLSIPHNPALSLRTVEKIPIRRTQEGRYLQQRVIIWQGLEPATLSITNLTVHFQTVEKNVPKIKIVVDQVEAAKPPPATSP